MNAAATTALVVLAFVGTAMATHPPLTGDAPAFGPFVDSLLAPLPIALGFAVFLAMIASFVLTIMYIRRETAKRIIGRFTGWALLTVTVAAILDTTTQSPRNGNTFGLGGSVGAWFRFVLEDYCSPSVRNIALTLLVIASLTIIATPIMRRIGVALFAGVHGFIAGIRRIDLSRVNPNVEPVLVKTSKAMKVEEPVLLKLYRPGKEPALIPVHTPPQPIRGLDDAMTETLPEMPRSFELPPLELLTDAVPITVGDNESALRERATLLEKTFADFGISVKVVGIHTGPVITQYEIALETGLRLNKVTVLADDVALNLKVPSVRIVAPLPGRNTVGIEVPNENRQTVRLKELILTCQAKTAKFKLPVFIGKDVEGRPLAYDLAAMPHLLIAGRTGTGKSVCLNTIILSLLYSRTPDECRMIMIDPKMVELSEYGRIPHLMHPVVTKPEKAEAILAWAVDKMEERYTFLSKARVRNVAAFNELGYEEIIRRIDPQSEDDRQAIPRSFPYIVIIIDEVGDLLMSMKKEVESHIIRLAQKSRAAGIHVILATQKPTVDVITGLIKSNMPARICFQVASRADSMVVLDEKGADKLLGMGDMLYMQPSSSTIVRAQGAYVDDREIERTVAHLETEEPNYESELLNLKAKAAGDAAGSSTGDYSDKLKSRDELYEQAIDVVVREQRGSTSLLQRALGIGYGRASRLIDFMAEDGIVGSFNGSSARDVLIDPAEWADRKVGVGV